ncbi:hypothetical protein SDC9_53981 [bioreactor metagenome]|uniref:DUF2892 domain-containing protein n=1 Tax=bioreactor metagenome TaxID=1076179 RepID=A0A644X0H0_9ZZZZ
MNEKCVPPTVKRVAYNTDPEVNEAIRNRTIGNISAYQNCSKNLLSERIKRLGEEWDTERVLEMGAASLVAACSVRGYRTSRCGWFLLSGAVSGFLLMHALDGWCPSLPVIRRHGVRTAEEIGQEKMAFKLIRGDFLHNTKDAEKLLGYIEKQ